MLARLEKLPPAHIHAPQFFQGAGGFGQSNKCVQCNKSVYPAEELRAQGTPCLTPI